jgi:hypothetical protein
VTRAVRNRILIAAAGVIAVLVAVVAVKALTDRSAADVDAAKPAGAAATGPATADPGPKTTAACGSVSVDLVPSCGAWLGMYPRTDAAGARTGDLQTNLASLEQRAGRKFDVVTRYHGWGDQLPDATDNAWRDSGHLLLVDLRARDFQTNAQVKWADIASGKQDAYLSQVAAGLKAYGAKVFFSFNQEPEKELEQGTGVAGSAQDYVAAYKHIHDVFQRAGATNAVWVWWVTGYLPHKDWITQLYPGDSYVDWVSYDPYDRNTCRNTAAETPQETVLPFLNWLNGSSLGRGKPVMISEYGSNGADRGGWYKGVGDLVKQTPRIKAVVPFNAQPDKCDFRLTTSAQKWDGFASMARDPFFNQPLPKT